MKIAVNTRFLLKGKLEGIGIYTQEIFKRVVQLLPEHEFYFFFDRKPDPQFIFSKHVKAVQIGPQARHPFLWYWWFEHSVPSMLKQLNIDLFISPDGFASLSTTVPQIITIHDLAFEHFDHHNPLLVQKYYKHFVPKYCAKAKKILAVSEFTKNDILNKYHIDNNKIDVAYNGFDSNELKQTETTSTSKNKLPYFLFIGAVHPRKNVAGLLNAFEIFKSKYPLSHQLVIAGRKAWMSNGEEQLLATMKYSKDIQWIENLERSELMSILQNAFALVYPSFYEGFGIPVVEAMAAGIPVITSKTSSLPEIAGDAAALIDSSNYEEIADAMFGLTQDNHLRNELIEKGKLRAREFSWDVSAQKIAAIIRSEIK